MNTEDLLVFAKSLGFENCEDPVVSDKLLRFAKGVRIATRKEALDVVEDEMYNISALMLNPPRSLAVRNIMANLLLQNKDEE